MNFHYNISALENFKATIYCRIVLFCNSPLCGSNKVDFECLFGLKLIQFILHHSFPVYLAAHEGSYRMVTEKRYVYQGTYQADFFACGIVQLFASVPLS